MNKITFESRWGEMRGQVKEWWDRLTDEDLEHVNGKVDQLVHLLQKKYGYTREQAAEEFYRRLWEAPAPKVKSRLSSGL